MKHFRFCFILILSKTCELIFSIYTWNKLEKWILFISMSSFWVHFLHLEFSFSIMFGFPQSPSSPNMLFPYHPDSTSHHFLNMTSTFDFLVWSCSVTSMWTKHGNCITETKSTSLEHGTKQLSKIFSNCNMSIWSTRFSPLSSFFLALP